MERDQDEVISELIDRIDAVIMEYPELGPHNVAGALLSRVVLLMTMDPAVGKELVKYVWEKLDEIEQADPGNFI